MAILGSALPKAVNVFIIAKQCGIYIERATRAILVLTAIPVVTVYTLLAILTFEQPHVFL